MLSLNFVCHAQDATAVACGACPVAGLAVVSARQPPAGRKSSGPGDGDIASAGTKPTPCYDGLLSPRSLPANVDKTVLPNGMCVLSEAMPSVRSVSLGVWLDAGSRHEAAPDSGITHFVEHMVFKGTERFSAREIACEIDGLGGHLDAFTSKETTAFTAKVLDERWPEALDILADMVQHPAFTEDDIERELRRAPARASCFCVSLRPKIQISVTFFLPCRRAFSPARSPAPSPADGAPDHWQPEFDPGVPPDPAATVLQGHFPSTEADPGRSG